MNRIVLTTFLLLVVMSGCDRSSTEPTVQTPPPATAVADCCQCASRGSSSTPSLPVACFPGTTNQSACDQACGSNRIGGLLTGSCSDGVRCQ